MTTKPAAHQTRERSYGELFRGRPRVPRPHGRIVVAWQDCSDKEFFEAIRPVSEPLRQAGRLFSRDLTLAKRLVVEHFLSRRQPLWAFDYRQRKAPHLPSRNFFFGPTVDLDKARRSLRYEFYDHNLTGHYHRLTSNVDWDRTRVRELGSAGWLTMSFAYWALFPAAGFAITRDTAYAKVFERCWRRWFDEFPTVATDCGLREWGAFNTLDPSGIDIWMNVGRRALVLVDVLYSGMLSAVPTHLAFDVIKYLWFVSELFKKLHRLRPGAAAFRRGNHNLFDLGTVPFCLGVLFPEFEGSEELVKGGRNVLRWHATDPYAGAIRADFSSWEHSSRYGWYAAGMFRQAIEVARLNGIPLLTARQERRVKAFLDHFADLTAPDGMLIPYGDCQPPPRGCHLETSRSLWTGTHAENVAAALHARSTCHSPARRPGKQCRLPPLTRFFPASGILVTRTAWKSDASLLFVTAEPREERSGHSHHDFGSFQLWVRGVPLIYDAATWAYRIDEIIPEERGYYYSAFSHNLLTIENYRPSSVFRAMGDVNRWWGDPHNPPVRTEKIEVHDGRGEMLISHQAYSGLKVRRLYRFNLLDGWLEVADSVEAEKRTMRTFRQWLHFGFGAKVSARDSCSILAEHCHVHATCRWWATETIQVKVERSWEVERAARVFNLAPPLRAFGECRTAATLLDIVCRIEW